MEIEGLEQILKRASAKNTCWPGCADAWSEENPAWGHCAMYTLFVNEYIGGKILSANAHLPDGKVIPHYFNSIPFSIAKNHDFGDTKGYTVKIMRDNFSIRQMSICR